MIIAFVGLMGSGKTTAADHLVNAYGFRKINFKDALVGEMKARLPNTLDKMVKLHGYRYVDDLFFYKPDLMRSLMQEYGTDVRRGDDENYWVEKWRNYVSLSPEANIVVDDCRFLNEAEAVKSVGGIIVRIVREDITDTGTHRSEVEQSNISDDYMITCGAGEIEKLFSSLGRILIDEQ